MFLPIGDSPNSPETPWATYGLIALNVCVFLCFLPLTFEQVDPNDPLLLEYARTVGVEVGAGLDELLGLNNYDLFVLAHGFQPAAPSLLDLLSAMFLHGGWMHLLGNMLFLWIFGDNVEHHLGQGRYVLAYLLTGALATCGDGLIRWGSFVPSVGASGAISGLLGCYFVWFRHNQVRVFILLFPIYLNTIDLPSRLVLGIYLVFDNLLPLVIGLDGGVAHGAHLGGFLGGMLLAYGLNSLRDARRLRPPVPSEGQVPILELTPAGVSQALRDAIDAEDLEQATRVVSSLPRRQLPTLLAPGDALLLAEALEDAGRVEPAQACYRLALGLAPDAAEAAAAHLGAARALIARGDAASAFQHVVAVLGAGATPRQEQEAQELLRRLASQGRSLPKRFRFG